jgi:hypothetical protein
MDKNEGGRPTEIRSLAMTGFDPPTYNEIGIKKQDAHVWQTIAAIPEAEFEEKLSDTRQADLETNLLNNCRVVRQLNHGSVNQTQVCAG